MKYFLQIFFLSLSISCYSQKTQKYKFDDSSNIYGCANVVLQKISKDWQYELMIEFEFDSIPKYTDFNINKYSKFIKLYINKYPVGNRYIHDICNDVIFDTAIANPVRYNAISGMFRITEFYNHNQMSSDTVPASELKKNFMISATIKNVVLENEHREKIEIPYEFFKRLLVGWIGG